MSDKMLHVVLNIHAEEVKSYCPLCGYGPLDGADGYSAEENADIFDETGDIDPDKLPEPMKPKPGCITLCGRCAGILIYDKQGGKLVIRKARSHETTAIQKEAPDTWAMLQFVAKKIKEGSSWKGS